MKYYQLSLFIWKITFSSHNSQSSVMLELQNLLYILCSVNKFDIIYFIIIYLFIFTLQWSYLSFTFIFTLIDFILLTKVIGMQLFSLFLYFGSLSAKLFKKKTMSMVITMKSREVNQK